MNKRIYLSVSALLLWGTMNTHAQQQAYKSGVTVSNVEAIQRGDSLYINMYMDLNGAEVNTHRLLELTPIVKTDGTETELPSVKVCGRNRYKAYKRDLTLLGIPNDGEYAVLRAGKSPETVDYRYVLPFEEWMKDARLELMEDQCGCAGVMQQITSETLAGNLTLEKPVAPYEVQPHVVYVQPEVEVKKQRELTGEAHLNFLVGKSNILPEFGNNPEELKKIRELVEEVKNDKDVTIRRIRIAGYASPEGTLALNQRLSEARAHALASYLTTQYGLSKTLFETTFGGEDWEGLVKEVENSDMQYKQEVLDIIRNVAVTAGREKKLMDLHRGEPYRYMLKEMFPALRKVTVTVDYDVKNFDVSEAAEISKTRPQNLSLNEMFAVAQTYKAGSEAFNDLFETAVRLFPGDDTANLNAAAAALSRKDTVTAARYLDRIKSKVRFPEYENNKGMLLLLTGDYDGAKQWLGQAMNAGVKAAGENLEELERKQANERLLRADNQ